MFLIMWMGLILTLSEPACLNSDMQQKVINIVPILALLLVQK